MFNISRIINTLLATVAVAGVAIASVPAAGAASKGTGGSTANLCVCVQQLDPVGPTTFFPIQPITF